ncbi:hypothetical protein [Streptomyces sp. NBC_00829]|uniref:hypothetical protein n=1 Tax=Streptomyces sp. NBC_00829 TaxID=2903679 RepID=UPI003868259B|nr:hypothetical protein OG293_18155 [Streptomyces sp. NBC_00829]
MRTWRFSIEATDSEGRRGTHSGLVDSHSEAAARQGVIESVQAAGYQPCGPVTVKPKRGLF